MTTRPAAASPDPADYFAQVARITKALACPTRLALLELLGQGPRTVEALAREAGVSVANASQHLRRLHAARLVDTDQRGLYVTYRLAGAAVGDCCRALRRLAEGRLAEIAEIRRRYLDRDAGLVPINRRDLLRRVRAGAVTLLDVRPAEEYQTGHLAGAVSIPLRELSRRLAELPRHREIVAYCRGPYCVLAVQAVDRLRARGYRARRLEDGVADWRAHGLPVAAGTEARPR